jgi:hypothetical protein
MSEFPFADAHVRRRRRRAQLPQIVLSLSYRKSCSCCIVAARRTVLEVLLDRHRLKPFGAGSASTTCEAITNGIPTKAAEEVTSRRVSHSPRAQPFAQIGGTT